MNPAAPKQPLLPVAVLSPCKSIILTDQDAGGRDMKRIILIGAAFLTLAACDGSDKTGPTELNERTDAARAAAAMSEAPADAPALPASLSFNEQGWAVWADWRYHTSGLVCPPDVAGFTFSKTYGEDESKFAACSYYGPAFQVMRMQAVESAGPVLSAFEQEQAENGSRRIAAEEPEAVEAERETENAAEPQVAQETLLTGDSAGHRAEMRAAPLPEKEAELTVLVEYSSPSDDALAAQVFEDAFQAQYAFTKRDRVQAET